MDIEHCDCLSWFSRRGESHEQDGERLLSATTTPQRSSASRDPAMAFGPSMERTGDHSTRRRNRQRPRCRTTQRMHPASATTTREHAARNLSAANTQPLDQRLVTRFVDTGEIIEELATLGHELEQPTPGMVVLDVGLEMLGKAVDALREDRHLHLRRPGVTG